MSQITTLTFFRYTTFWGKVWAFMQMHFMHKNISKIEGQTFYKLLGSGKEGFDPLPDWSVYALLQVWEHESFANTFFDTSKVMQKYAIRYQYCWTLFLKNTSSKGEWSSQKPFMRNKDLDESNPYIVVITRATIKKRMLYRFWKYVPTSQQSLAGNPGLLYTKGIGEMPIVQMATFSLWKDKESLMAYAYQSKEHKKAIEKTKILNWYKEESFSRFQPYKSLGTWDGINPLPDL